MSESKQLSGLKKHVYCALEDLSCAHGLARVLGIFLILLVVVNAFSVFIQPSVTSFDGVAGVLLVVWAISGFCFAFEYIARVWIADCVYPDYQPFQARLRYLFSLMGLVDLLAFLPMVLAMFFPSVVTLFNAVCLIRLVRLIKISRYMRGIRSISRVFRKRGPEIMAAFMVLGLLVVTSSLLMYRAEHAVQPDAFDSVFSGLYWAMTTITSTGYGDLVPVTPFGRIVGFITMLLSIGVVAIPAGIFSAGFVAEFKAQDHQDHQEPKEEGLQGSNVDGREFS